MKYDPLHILDEIKELRVKSRKLYDQIQPLLKAKVEITTITTRLENMLDAMQCMCEHKHVIEHTSGDPTRQKFTTCKECGYEVILY